MLEPGGTTEEITITGQAPLVDTDSSTVGLVITEEKLRELPLNGRNFVELALIVPGSVTLGRREGGVENWGGVSVNVNGGTGRQNTYTIDGADVTSFQSGFSSLIPSLEAIQEFKVRTSTYSAESGRFAGANISLEIKSGTKDFHGSAFEFLRDDSFVPVAFSPLQAKNRLSVATSSAAASVDLFCVTRPSSSAPMRDFELMRP